MYRKFQFFVVVVVVVSKHLTQSDRYLHPNDDLITDEKVQAKFFAEKKRDRVRKTKIKQDKIIDGMRLELTVFGLSDLSRNDINLYY